MRVESTFQYAVNKNRQKPVITFYEGIICLWHTPTLNLRALRLPPVIDLSYSFTNSPLDRHIEAEIEISEIRLRLDIVVKTSHPHVKNIIVSQRQRKANKLTILFSNKKFYLVAGMFTQFEKKGRERAFLLAFTVF